MPVGLTYLAVASAGGTASHDPGLDVAEPTWEEAIVVLAAKVRQRYGDDRARVPGQSAR